MPSEALQEWVEEAIRHTGRRIDNGDGEIRISHLGITPRMHRTLAEEAAELLCMDLEDIRTMSGDRLLALLRPLVRR